MNDFKVLVDLSTIMTGNSQYSGIPQDTRSIFKLFSLADHIHPTGLICSSDRDSALIKFKKFENKVQTAYAYTHYFFKLEETLAGKSNDELSRLDRARLKLLSYSQYFPLLFRTLKKDFYCYELDKKYDDYIWRKAFDGLIDAQFKESVLTQPFSITNFSKYIQKNRVLLNLKPATLHTPQMDFAIFQCSIPQSPHVSKETIPIIRFHDTIPLRMPETLVDFNHAKVFAKNLCAASKYAVFACTSQPLRDELIKLIPSMEKRVFVVPPAITIENSLIEKKKEVISTIVKARQSSFLKTKLGVSLPDLHTEMDSFNYIICVSTIDPRKNHLSLIRAWERIRYQYDDKLKLLLVGSFGIKADAVIRAMKPHLLTGSIIHLEKVPVFELGTLYTHAKAFILPSFYEGCGNTALEAMQAGTPVIVSDIPTTRWTLGEAALYCDPYDVSSISDCLVKLLYSSENGLINELVDKGKKRASQFSSSVITQQWTELFATLKSQQKNKG